MTTAPVPLLSVRGLTRRFGALLALSDVSFDVNRGDCLGLIGPNGSGKTTLFNTVTGFFQPHAGRVFWKERDVTGWAPDKLAGEGLVRTFQHAMAFASETVAVNVQIAVEALPRQGASPAGVADRVDELLRFCALDTVRGRTAADLPYGYIRRLGVAIALAASAEMIMLDEPAAGLNDAESEELARLLIEVRRSGTTLLVIDHDMPFLMPLVDRLIVLQSGRKLIEGSVDEVRSDERVKAAYLGTGRSVPPVDAADREAAERGPVLRTAGPGMGARQVARSAEGRTLSVEGVRAGYGANEVLHGVGLRVEAGEAVAVLGANGAGKTTLLRAICGLLPLRSGRIAFGAATVEARDGSGSGARRRLARLRGDGQGAAAERLYREGVVMVPEGRHVFPTMSVRDNLLVTAPPNSAEAARLMEWVLDLFPVLKTKLQAPGGSLSGGQQQALAIGRGLMARPRLLCLDEPTLGLAPALMETLTEQIGTLRASMGISLLIVEQSISLALSLTDRVYVMHAGAMAAPVQSREASTDEIMAMYLAGG